MKITCIQENLNRALSHASRIISLRNNVPILENILISTDQGRLKVSATDLEIGINYWIGVKIDEDGKVALPSRLLSEFISSIKEEKVSIKTTVFDGEIKGEKYSAKIKGMDPEDYPIISDIMDHYLFTVSSKQILSALSQVSFATASDQARPVLSGVYFSYDKEQLKIAATDSFRLAEKSINVTKGEKKTTHFIIPTRAIQEITKLAKEASDNIDFCFDGNQVMINFGSVHLVTRLIDGQYPNYEQIIPSQFETIITLDKEELYTTCKVASIFARESGNSVKIKIEARTENPDQGELSIIGQGVQVGESTNTIPVSLKGKDIEIAFNAKYIIDVLATVQEKEITWKFVSPTSPAVIQVSNHQDYLYLIMPLKNT